jgi:hypothetical protein
MEYRPGREKWVKKFILLLPVALRLGSETIKIFIKENPRRQLNFGGPYLHPVDNVWAWMKFKVREALYQHGEVKK